MVHPKLSHRLILRAEAGRVSRVKEMSLRAHFFQRPLCQWEKKTPRSPFKIGKIVSREKKKICWIFKASLYIHFAKENFILPWPRV